VYPELHDVLMSIVAMQKQTCSTRGPSETAREEGAILTNGLISRVPIEADGCQQSSVRSLDVHNDA
jgi:hypothetical protein